MAKKAAEDEAKTSGKKRLARAKVKRADTASAKGAPSEAARAKKRKEVTRNVVITVFAVIMAFSMALPSLSTIFANNRQNVAAQEAADASAEEADEDAADEQSMEKVDENYATTITPLEDKLKEDPKDLATLLSLGNDYMSWAYAASQYSDDEDSQDHVNEIFEQAIDYYDQYLELNDAVSVRVNRALCVFYGRGSDEGIEEMTELTETYPDYGPAWANLGLLYESSWQTDKAKEMYEKAAEVDADDEYNAKTFANQRLAALNSGNVENTSDTITSTTPTTTSLTDELLSSSGTSF